jgi:5'-nucleotidase
VTREGIEGLEFLDEAETINKYVPALRKRNVGAIVALVHEGGTQSGGFDDCTNLSGAIVPIVEDPAAPSTWSSRATPTRATLPARRPPRRLRAPSAG